MTTFFLTAAVDDQDLAQRLQADLTAMGFSPAPSLLQAETVLALLSPAALDSPLLAQQWQTARHLQKPLVVLGSGVSVPPPGLAGLPFHSLDQASYSLVLARLVQILLSARSKGGASYQVGLAIQSAVGESATVINAPGGSADLEVLAQAVAYLARRGQPGLAPGEVTEVQSVLLRIQEQLVQGFQDVLQGQGTLAAHFDMVIQALAAVLIARLDERERRLSEEILAVLESGAVAADELERHLEVIEAAVAQVRSALPELNPAAQVLSAPGVDVQHKLKLAIPIIPTLLSYEGEFALGQSMDLEALWEKLTRLVRRR